MPSEERDRQFEQALQKHLRGGVPEAACADAETLAAYHERTLSLEELTHWKEHISACTRCQEILAVLETTSTVALNDWEKNDLVARTHGIAGASIFGAQTRAMPREELSAPTAAVARMPVEMPGKKAARSTWRWIAPVGALAAGLLIFVVVRENHERMATSLPAVQVAENREATSPPPAMAKPEELPQGAKRGAPAQLRTDKLKKLDEKDVAALRTPAPSVAGRPSHVSSYAAGGQEADKLAPKQEVNSKGIEPSPGLPSSSAAPAQDRAAASPEAAGSPAPPVATTQSSAGAVAGATSAVKKQANAGENREKSWATTKEAGSMQKELPAAVPATPSRNYNSLREVAATNSHVILAPDNKHAWRLGAAGMIESTSDGGINWKTQQSGVNGELTAGSAPSERICWLVGKAGTILLTTDGGKHWKSIVSPLREDLGGVHAVDANHSAIWNIANRKSFETADGGVTWSATANE
jgi:hypothetical protein